MRTYRNHYIDELTRLVRWVSQNPLITLLITGLFTLSAALYAINNIKINSDTSDMIDPSAVFLKNYRSLQDAFPHISDTIVIVIEAQGSQEAARAARDMHEELVKQDDLFQTVFAPAALDFFQDNAFLYLSSEELEEVVDQLAKSQPALSALSTDPNLKGLLGLIDTGLDAYENGEDLPALFIEMMDRISENGENLLAGNPAELVWDDAFELEGDERAIQVITVQGEMDFTDLQHSRNAINVIRTIANDLDLTPENGVTVRLTGDIPLSDEEMSAVQESVSFAGTASVILICIILGYGIQSLRIIVAIFATLFTGLIWTMAWGLLTVGEFNMISATFAVLFIGLGIDFSIHCALRYQEAIDDGDHFREAITTTARSIGGAMSLCAVSSAIGFLSFMPTSYKGIAALGTISGGGMILALIASFTVLPATLSLFGKPSKSSTIATIFTDVTRSFFERVGRHAKQISLGSLVVMVLAISVASQTVFDYNTLALKDQDSESLQTLKTLQDEGIATDYAVTILADNLDKVEEVAAKLEALETIKEVQTQDIFVPEDQDYKFDLLDETAMLLWPVLTSDEETKALSESERRTIVRDLLKRLSILRINMNDQELLDAAQRFATVLRRIEREDTEGADLATFENLLVSNIDEPLSFLRTALSVDYIEFDILPEEITSRIVATDGRVQVIGLPKDDITDFDVMHKYVDEVIAAFPNATGRPIVEAGVGDLVVDSFWIAMILALTAISIILLVTVRHASDVALIMAPLVMAASLSIATGVLFDVPLNQANIIVIPLILGLGVDNGIHIVMRFHDDDSMIGLMTSSTPRAVILSTLTTLGTFGALSMSIHQGIQSMGLLLAISMLYLLICTIVVLPAMLYWRSSYLKSSQN